MTAIITDFTHPEYYPLMVFVLTVSTEQALADFIKECKGDTSHAKS